MSTFTGRSKPHADSTAGTPEPAALPESYEAAGGPFLSVIIPSFNEEATLSQTLARIIAFAGRWGRGIEVVVVDNASTDRTADIVRDFSSRYPLIRGVTEPRRGKGAAVKTGIAAGRGDYLLICDADMAVPIEEVDAFFPPLCSEPYDISIASREKSGAMRHGEPWHRHVMGRVFNLIVRLLLLPGLQDTQCGFKLFTRTAARDLFGLQSVDGWGFDVEILYAARRRGYRIVEIPVSWYYGRESKIRPLRDALKMFMEIMAVRRNGRQGRYDQAPPGGAGNP